MPAIEKIAKEARRRSLPPYPTRTRAAIDGLKLEWGKRIGGEVVCERRSRADTRDQAAPVIDIPQVEEERQVLPENEGDVSDNEQEVIAEPVVGQAPLDEDNEPIQVVPEFYHEGLDQVFQKDTLMPMESFSLLASAPQEPF